MAKRMVDTGPSHPRAASNRMGMERERIKKRFGSVSKDDESNLQRIHSEQEGDIPLGQPAKMKKRIQGLRKVFRPFA